MADKPGADSNGTCKAHSGVVETLKDHERRIGANENAIRKIMNRPPVWVTVLMSLLSAALSAALTFIAKG